VEMLTSMETLKAMGAEHRAVSTRRTSTRTRWCALSRQNVFVEKPLALRGPSSIVSRPCARASRRRCSWSGSIAGFRRRDHDQRCSSPNAVPLSSSNTG
jgi:hypothetical protein